MILLTRPGGRLVANLLFASIEDLVAAFRRGVGRAGLYPDTLRPEDRLAIGEMPFVSSSSKGFSLSMKPKAVDQWADS